MAFREAKCYDIGDIAAPGSEGDSKMTAWSRGLLAHDRALLAHDGIRKYGDEGLEERRIVDKCITDLPYLTSHILSGWQAGGILEPSLNYDLFESVAQFQKADRERIIQMLIFLGGKKSFFYALPLFMDDDYVGQYVESAAEDCEAARILFNHYDVFAHEPWMTKELWAKIISFSGNDRIPMQDLDFGMIQRAQRNAIDALPNNLLGAYKSDLEKDLGHGETVQ